MIVSGSVFDNDMKIIPNVNVVVLNENRSTTANIDGKFSIKVNSENSQLRFSHAGYDYDTISVKEFNKLGYINLLPPTLPEIIIPNPYTNTKKTDNTWLWLLGISGLGFIGYKLASKKKAVNVTV